MLLILAIGICCHTNPGLKSSPPELTAPGLAINQRPAPAEIFGPPGRPVQLLVGNGGAGLLGLIQLISEDFIASRHKDYAIGWVRAGSGENFEHVRYGRIDVALTYEPLIEDQLVRDGLATHRVLVFHDRFILVGPSSDPAGLHTISGDIGDDFERIAQAGARNPNQVRFLSRDNSSGTTAKEHAIWATLQANPWRDRSTPWYVRFDSFPTDALRRANEIGAYTLNDLGTWLGNPSLRTQLAIFAKNGSVLDNPCSVIVTVPRGGQPSSEAIEFADYWASPRAQNLIAQFGRSEHGEPLYQPAN